MGAVDRNPDREATFNYCMDMVGQLADLLQRQAGEPEMAAILRAIAKSQRSSFAAPQPAASWGEEAHRYFAA